MRSHPFLEIIDRLEYLDVDDGARQAFRRLLVEIGTRHGISGLERGEQLREENRKLKHELREQRTDFQRQIDDLKAQLAKAVDQVKGFLQKIGMLTRQRDEAEAEVEQLRAILYPDEQRSHTQPGHG